MKLTKGELFKLEQRVAEIEQIFDEYAYIEYDIIQNLDSELSEIIFKLEKSLELIKNEKQLNNCQIVKH